MIYHEIHYRLMKLRAAEFHGSYDLRAWYLFHGTYDLRAAEFHGYIR